MASASLSWTLIVPTYSRADVLLRSLGLAARQSRPPEQVIVVDASPDWQSTRDRVMQELAAVYPAIQWTYVKAWQRSIPNQRNQGIALASTPIIFLFDDDSLMYPDCAEKILELYEADTSGAIVGVNAMHCPIAPDSALRETYTEYSTTKHYSRLARWVRKLLSADDNHFIPYDPQWPDKPIPEAVARRGGKRWRVGAGWGLTFRLEIARKVPFAALLQSYAAGEDTDMTYRASRLGAYVGRDDARLCHIGSASGRLPVDVVTQLKGLNTLVLARLRTTDLDRSLRLNRRVLMRRLVIGLIKDLKEHRLTLPEARGWAYAALMAGRIFAKEPEELEQWYAAKQQAILANT